MAILLSDLQSYYERFKKDLSDVEDTLFIDWAKNVYYFIYENLKGVDPERFITQTVYYVVTDPDVFTLPDDFMDMRQGGCGFFELTSAQIAYDAQAANFTVGETITGGTSGATAVVTADTDSGATGTLTINQVNGVFVDNETLTGSVTGSATANGAPVYTINTNNRLGETGFGRADEGFYLNRSDLVFTGASEKSFVFRYIPQPFSFTDTDEYFTLNGESTGIVLVEDRHLDYLAKAIDVYYEQWDGNNVDTEKESTSDFRMVRALGEILSSIKRTPHIAQMDNPANDF